MFLKTLPPLKSHKAEVALLTGQVKRLLTLEGVRSYARCLLDSGQRYVVKIFGLPLQQPKFKSAAEVSISTVRLFEISEGILEIYQAFWALLIHVYQTR